MTAVQYIDPLREYVVHTHLDGRADVTAATPLLEWGVIDSFGLADLLRFIDERFAIAVPTEEITPENFESLSQLGALLSRLDAEPR
jgi:acyl carrier protein